MIKQNFQRTNDQVDIAVISEKVNNIEEKVTEINHKLDEQYVPRVEFEPIKKIVYGLISLILTSVFLAILALIIKK